MYDDELICGDHFATYTYQVIMVYTWISIMLYGNYI